jgi:single-strand DNA-binding protein
MQSNNLHSSNLVVLRGRLSSEPTLRQLPSGDTLTNLDVTTDVDGAGVSVPVVLASSNPRLVDGDAVVVTGHVRRRFFRAGGVTQSRTEVIAASVVKLYNQRSAARAIEKAVAALLE